MNIEQIFVVIFPLLNQHLFKNLVSFVFNKEMKNKLSPYAAHTSSFSLTAPNHRMKAVS